MNKRYPEHDSSAQSAASFHTHHSSIQYSHVTHFLRAVKRRNFIQFKSLNEFRFIKLERNLLTVEIGNEIV